MTRSTTEEFEGYRAGDVTYCVDPRTDELFPVVVVKVGRNFLDAASYNVNLTAAVTADFEGDPKNRRFVRPRLPPRARFGGFDERIVNSDRVTGPELRLLPYHYNTFSTGTIRQRHAENPDLWPIPTGILRDRWFS